MLMSIFQNSFFSVAGQKERLSNVVNTVKASVTGTGVSSNTGIKVLDKALSLSASHPFATAGVVAVGTGLATGTGVGRALAPLTGKTVSTNPVIQQTIVKPSATVTKVVKDFVNKGSSAVKEVSGNPVVQTGVTAKILSTGSKTGNTPLVNNAIAPPAPNILPPTIPDNSNQVSNYTSPPTNPFEQTSSVLTPQFTQKYDLPLNVADTTIPTLSNDGIQQVLNDSLVKETLVKPSKLNIFKHKVVKHKTIKHKTIKHKTIKHKTTKHKIKHHKKHFGTEAQFKRKGGLDVKYTKNGQPYVLGKNGKARFIKKSK